MSQVPGKKSHAVLGLVSFHVTTPTPDTDGMRNSDNAKQAHAAAAAPPSIQPMLSMKEPCSHCPQIMQPADDSGRYRTAPFQPTRVVTSGGSSPSLNGIAALPLRSVSRSRAPLFAPFASRAG